MLKWLLNKIIGSKNEREIKKLKPFVEKINSLEGELDKLTNSELRERALNLFEKIRSSEETKKAFEKGEITPEVIEGFALVREVAKRTLGMRHFDVQLIGGLVLHQGKIAEMKTGEGKTLVASLPAAVNGFTDRGVHIVTVNDYLARRDAQWMGPIYKFLGLEVGVINSDGKTYIVDWVDPELAQRAIENDWRVWEKGYFGEILERQNVEAKKAFFTHLVEVPERRKAYECQITYGTNSEFGFDYLRDNMAIDLSQVVQVKNHYYAIVDEVDSILIDEARTPLIISGPAEIDPSIYYTADAVVRNLEKGKDFELDEKNRTAYLTEEGVRKIEQILGIENLYDPKHTELVHAILQALRAHHLFHKEVHYIVRNGEVLIVDEFTGRVLPGRRWSDGLHQAIEVKEGVEVQPETQTLASITYQNYFRLYKKLAGMTGTAETESVEFKEIYNLEVVVIPTRKPVARIDHPDLVFKTKRAKWKKVVEEVFLNYLIGRPVLVGTVSIEDNELLSSLLKDKKLLKEIFSSEEFKKRLEEAKKKFNLSEEEIKKKLQRVWVFGIPHNVLNAKHHEKEAEIVAQAGRLNAVTIATNMAGRGTDILLGGNPEFLAKEILRKKGYENPEEAPEEEWKKALEEAIKITSEEKEKVKKLGGLYVIGTERHESRRIDNQLRGRSGRQGDPGESRFIISLEDNLIRLFGGERVQKLMEMLNIPEDEPLESKLVSKAIENAQKRVEAQNFQIRKRILDMDDVMNVQRNVVYSLRRKLLEGKGLRETIAKFMEDVAQMFVDRYAQADEPELWEIERNLPPKEREGRDYLERKFEELTGEKIEVPENVRDREELKEFLLEKMKEIYSRKEEFFGKSLIRELEKALTLQVLDTLWRKHLHALDRLREGIYLRGYAMRDPVTEFKKEGYQMFENFLNEFKYATLQALFHVELMPEEPLQTEVEEINEPTEERKPRAPKPRKLKDRLKERQRKKS
ncbi:MAG: preprotein translocase subunit SecA [Gammaproteobacteria bacterium]|nr:MAG: preprotein translocase subunit SecA [Gammaproteobacteria bacterium]